MDQIPPAKPEMDQEMIEAAASALREERLVMGESVFKFEEAFARYVGVKHAVSLSSGTDALIIALTAMDCRREIITTCSFIATANVLHAGGSGLPRCQHQRLQLDEGSDKVFTKRTKATARSHIRSPCDMNEITKWLRSSIVIEIARPMRRYWQEASASGHMVASPSIRPRT